MFGSVQLFVFVILGTGIFVLELFALIEALRYSNEAYYYTGKRNKSFWTAVLGSAAAIGFLGLPPPLGAGFTSPLGILGIAGAIAAGYFLTGVRPQLQSHGGPRRKPGKNQSRGGW